MTEVVDPLNVLAVDDDPGTVREIESLLGDSRLRFHFADTSNAFSRILEAESVDLAVVHVHSGSEPLLDPLSRQLRSSEPPISLIAMVSPDAEAALAASHLGVNGCVRIDDQRSVARVIHERVALIRENRSQREALRQSSDIHERYNLLLESSREAIAYLHEGLHIYANPSYLDLFGYADFEELEGFSILDLLSAGKGAADLKQLLKSLSRGDLPEEALELKAHRADGEEFIASVEFAPARYDGEACTQIMIRERVEAGDNAELQQEIEKLRSHDILTGLLNRQAFIRQLQDELASPPAGRHMAVLLVALDEHSKLQEKIGAAATDLLIRQTAEAFCEAIDDQMLPARLSDHILAARIWFEERSDAESLATRIIETFSGRILEIRDKSPTVTASVGLAVGGNQLFSADELLAQSESALREAQRTGGNSYVRYRPSTDPADAGDAAQWTERLRHALNNEEFRLVRLPITSMEDDDFLISEFESRMRVDGSDEIIMPATFRPAAVQSGLAIELDRDLIQNLIRWLGNHPEEREPMLVPLSGQSLADDEFILELQNLVDDDTLDGRRLILGFQETEVRESVREFQRLIRRLGARGVRFALLDVTPDAKVDLVLKNVDIDFLKLGGDVSAALRNNEVARLALEALATAASDQEIQVIAPQVENTTDLATLWQLGIKLVQDDFVRDEED
ncbi:MAG TPA: EAL domain-containing protein [Wenzhouxiangellaceae bacterium]|nr:EAL domain-containing protein [Wenzhouxiangellaceae bacterium]